MNQAPLKFYNICNTGTGFQVSSNTTTEDIIVMLAGKKRNPKPTDLNHPNDVEPDTNIQTKIPPFLSYLNQTSDTDPPKYKADDRKIWNGVDYYF